jgi:hypothetical protein
MPGPHSAKDKRMAAHVYAGSKERGYGDERAKQIAWGTVTKFKERTKGKKVSKSERIEILGRCFERACTLAKDMTMNAPRGSNNSSSSAPTPPPAPKASTIGVGPATMKVTGAPVNITAPAPSAPKPTGISGESTQITHKSAIQVVTLDEVYAEMKKAAGGYGGSERRSTPRGGPAAAAPATGETKKFPRHDAPRVPSQVHPRLIPGAAPSASGKPREAPSGATLKPHEYANQFENEEPTHPNIVPIHDKEAEHRINTGRHKTPGPEQAARITEKSNTRAVLAAIKALSTGYGNVSGGGALKAPNRGFLSVHDLNRAVNAPPAPGSSNRPYLPGVHAAGAKPKYGDAAHKILGFPPKKTKSITSKKAPKVIEGGGAVEMSMTGKREDVVQKSVSDVKWIHRSGIGGGKRSQGVASHGTYQTSQPNGGTKHQLTYVPHEGSRTSALGLHDTHEAALHAATEHHAKMTTNKAVGDATMLKTNFNDLFKSELGSAAGEEVLCACPHCEQPITKSDLAKGHGGKGKATNLTGKEHGKSSAHVVDQNPEGGVMRGGEGKGVLDSSRGVPGAKKTDENHVQSTDRGKSKKLPGMVKGDEVDETTDEPVKKSLVTVRGTGYVSYVTNDDPDQIGSDAYIAKSILEGGFGGTPPTEPLDRGNDMTRLLI